MPAGPQPPSATPRGNQNPSGGRGSEDRDPSCARDYGGTASRFPGNLEDPHRLGDVLDPLLAERRESDRQPGSDLVAYSTREANPAGLGQRLQPSGDVDPVAKEIRAF